jgi:phosphoribosylanthranilate isomerase
MDIAIKICGMRSASDITAAKKAGADFVGIVVGVPSSVRSVSEDEAVKLSQASQLPVVIVTVNMDCDRLVELVSRAQPYAIQLHGDEPPDAIRKLKKLTACEIWKAMKLPPQDASFDEAFAEHLLKMAQQYVSAGADAILFDATPKKGAYGGTGLLSHWGYARFLTERLRTRTILAGGLNPKNVQDAINSVRPWGVDVSSGVEVSKGIKAFELMDEFVKNARTAASKLWQLSR